MMGVGDAGPLHTDFIVFYTMSPVFVAVYYIVCRSWEKKLLSDFDSLNTLLSLTAVSPVHVFGFGVFGRLSFSST